MLHASAKGKGPAVITVTGNSIPGAEYGIRAKDMPALGDPLIFVHGLDYDKGNDSLNISGETIVRQGYAPEPGKSPEELKKEKYTAAKIPEPGKATAKQIKDAQEKAATIKGSKPAWVKPERRISFKDTITKAGLDTMDREHRKKTSKFDVEGKNNNMTLHRRLKVIPAMTEALSESWIDDLLGGGYTPASESGEISMKSKIVKHLALDTVDQEKAFFKKHGLIIRDVTQAAHRRGEDPWESIENYLYIVGLSG